MATKLDCKNLLLRYLDEATKKGVAIPATKNADYVDKFNYFLNTAQIYVAQQIKIPDSFNITQNPIANMLGTDDNFKIQQYLPGTTSSITATGAGSYYFEIDNIGTVIITKNDDVIVSISNTVEKEFTVYKGNTGALATDIITITFSGSYPYNFRNTALFAYAFANSAAVPSYTPYVEYDMPSDFLELDNVINRTDPMIYKEYSGYKFENNKKIYFKYYDKGSFDINYFKYPIEILPDASDSTVLSVADNAITLVVLWTGVISTTDNMSLSNWFRSTFNEQIANTIKPVRRGPKCIQTIYNM